MSGPRVLVGPTGPKPSRTELIRNQGGADVRGPGDDPRVRATTTALRRASARGAVEPEPVGDGRGLGAAPHAELGEDPRDVDARGLLGHVELGPDLAVRAALGDEREHLALARREPEGIVLSGVRPAG